MCFKGELSFQDDTLIEGGQKEGLHNGIHYIEARKFDSMDVRLGFYFVTRCYSDYLSKVLGELQASPPDVIIMNSCLWDLHRYGPHGPAAFKKNLRKLMEDLKKRLPTSTFIWMATLPVDRSCKAGFLPVGENPLVQSNEILVANFVAFQMIREYGRIFLNFNPYFCQQLHHREKDGVHWNGVAHRRMTHMLLTEVSKLWGKRVGFPVIQEAPLPFRYHRAASLPELWFPDHVNAPVCRQTPNAIPSYHPSNSLHNQIRPQFHNSKPLSTGVPPCYRSNFVGDQAYLKNAQTGLKRPQHDTLKRPPILNTVAKCFGFAKKRCHSDVESIPFSEGPVKRPCIRGNPECGGDENYLPVAAPNWCLDLGGQSNWYNTANFQKQLLTSRYMENHHRLEPNEARPSSKYNFSQRFQSWYLSKFRKFKNEVNPVPNAGRHGVYKKPVYRF